MQRGKKETKMFFRNIFYKTRVFLMEFGIHGFKNKFAARRVNVFPLT